MNTGGDYTFEIKTVWIKSQSSLSQSHYQRIEFGAPTKGNSYQSSQQQPHQKHKQNEKRNVYDLLSSKKRPKENWCDKTELVVVNVVFAAAVAACCSISIAQLELQFHVEHVHVSIFYTLPIFFISPMLSSSSSPLISFWSGHFCTNTQKKIKIKETKKNTQRKIPSLVFINNVPARREWAC